MMTKAITMDCEKECKQTKNNLIYFIFKYAKSNITVSMCISNQISIVLCPSLSQKFPSMNLPKIALI